MSTPASCMARTASGFRPCGSVPAEYASIWSAFSARAQPSAIWLRQELPVQRKRMRGRLAASAIAAASVLGAAVVEGVGEGAEGTAELGVAHAVEDGAALFLCFE